MPKNIEVELRGLLTEVQSAELSARLALAGVRCEADDKDTYFFNVPRGVFKICDEISKNQAKLSLKIGDEATGALEELEVPIARDHVTAFLGFFGALGYREHHLVPQQRQNFFLDGANLSLKHTPDFQHHFELEGRLLEDESQVESERARLHRLCGEYGLTPLTPEEITARIAEIRRRIGFVKLCESAE